MRVHGHQWTQGALQLLHNASTDQTLPALSQLITAHMLQAPCELQQTRMLRLHCSSCIDSDVLIADAAELQQRTHTHQDSSDAENAAHAANGQIIDAKDQPKKQPQKKWVPDELYFEHPDGQGIIVRFMRKVE